MRLAPASGRTGSVYGARSFNPRRNFNTTLQAGAVHGKKQVFEQAEARAMLWWLVAIIGLTLPMKQSPPRPSFALTLGVSGHRPSRDPKPGAGEESSGREFQADKVRGAIDNFLGVLKEAVDELSKSAAEWFDSAPPVLAMVSSLAEGSDRIAAQAALAIGLPLDVVLPCSRTIYEQTFADDPSRAEFGALFDRARARLILPLREAPEAAREAQLAQAYEAAGLTMLAQADILIAVWDGEPARGRGGTGDIVDDAARQGTPVVVIDPSEGAMRLLWPGVGPFALPARRARDLPAVAVDKDTLAQIVRGLVLPPQSEHERAGLEMFLTTRAEMGGADGPTRSAVLDVMRATPSAASDSNRIAATRLFEGFAAAEQVAQHNARAFRTAFVCNFFIGAIAAGFISLSILLNDWHHWFVGAELVLVSGVAFSTFWAVHKKWHRRWFEAREVAERLRVAETFWMLGVWPHNLTPAQPSWSGWYARAILRAQPLFSGDLAELLASARQTLAALARRSAPLSRRQCGKARAARPRAGIGRNVFPRPVGRQRNGVPASPNGARRRACRNGALCNLALAIVFPAIAAAIYGVRLFGDFEDIVRRSRRTGRAHPGAAAAARPGLGRSPDVARHGRARPRRRCSPISRPGASRSRAAICQRPERYRRPSPAPALRSAHRYSHIAILAARSLTRSFGGKVG